MKPDYKNWVPKSMVYGLAGGTVAAFILFLLLGATEAVFHGTPRLVCGILFGIGTLVLLFFTVWMGALHKTFDYNGKRKLSKTIIDGTAKYVTIPDGGTGLDVGCGSGALTIASAKRNPKATMVGCDIWSGAYKAVFTKKRCEDNAKAEGVKRAMRSTCPLKTKASTPSPATMFITIFQDMINRSSFWKPCGY